MIHLLAGLLRAHDPVLSALVVLEALLGSAAGVALLGLQSPAGRWAVRRAVLFGCAVAATSWLSFVTALAGTYPKLSLAVPLDSALPAVAISLLASISAGIIQQRGARSARNAMLAGSLLACGFSCMLFIGMAGLVRPFQIAYDLTAVLIVMTLGAALCGLALREMGNTERRHRRLVASGLIAIAINILALGSLAAILPFDAWLATVLQTDDLASSPIAIIIAAEAVGVLALGLSGSLLDNRVAARGRMESDRFRQLADSAFEGILIHRDDRILDGNRSLAALLGVPLGALRASPMSRFLLPDSDLRLWTSEGGAAVETDIVAADGSICPVEILSRIISYQGGSAVVTALRDVRERRISEERIRFLAHHDVLTELPNRAMLSARLEHALPLAARSGVPLAVLCLDLDGFKMVNDTLGHAAGDQLLVQVAGRLRQTLRSTDFVARLGGDEFIVVQTTGGHPDEPAAHLARRIVDGFVPGFRIDGTDVNVGVSIGIAVFPDDGADAASLMKNADIALYHAKEHARGWFCQFRIGIDQALHERRQMEQDLRTALQNNEFTLSFQPVFGSDLAVIAFEALLRWTHPTQGPISPARFIPVAEASGLIIPLGEWVMRTACSEAMSWKQPCRIAVNLSPAQFVLGDLQATVTAMLAETGLAPHRLELEITEGVLMDNNESAMHALSDLRALGVRLALDDFGTGFSSLSYLQRFSFDTLKIDRSFVQRLESSVDTRAIVNAIISMSRELGIAVTAEGVETQAQFDLLAAQGCDAFQGFLLGFPMAQNTVAPFLLRRLMAERDAA
ncbi:putative bifunctional diguanylate cyclase/phosphodiesterase [Lichenicola sp.]|uniref:putative bifunctional diguanylate cyclase/phosphodiesterase n=1 Tax=Lichenicola sp. TaxID=2804529 RepID=UPI003AFF914E